MQMISEENLTASIIAGNTGNIENKIAMSSTGAALDEVELFPKPISAPGNEWEQPNLSIQKAILDDLPVIPKKYKTLSIDGQMASLTGQWAYRDEQSQFLFYVQRFDTATGHKEFRPLSPTKEGDYLKWQRKAPPEPRPLYGLDRLAANPNAKVIVCEGEKATDAAMQLFPDMIAVCSMNGANSPEKSYWLPLHGRTVLFWGDFDEPGNKYISSVEKLVLAAGADVIHCINPQWFLKMGQELGLERETLPAGWDAADARQEGFTAHNIQHFLKQGEGKAPHVSLFTQTLSQQIETNDPLWPGREPKKTDAHQKSLQTQELFKDSEFALIEYRKGFKNGVYWQQPCVEGEDPKLPFFLCSPLNVIAETRDENQSNWGRLLSWQDNDGHTHHWACPVEMLAANDTAEFRRELARNGLTISSNLKARQKLADYVLSFPTQSPDRVRCVSITGWHGSRYVLSNKVFGNKDGESVIYQGSTNGDYSTAGTMDEWKREVSARASGNSRIIFAISTSFAGPLIEMANESGGGFQFTGETSKGKTSTIIDPAASVWGHPDRFAKKWRTTLNGLEALCQSRNHSTLILDDLGQSDAKECGHAAYLISNGQSKARMLKEGGNRQLLTWRTLLLSSGEIDIAQHMAEAGRAAKGGQVIRLPSIPADAGAGMFAIEQLHDQQDGRQFADTMKAVTRQYYGTAGEAFLEKLTDPTILLDVASTIRDGINHIIQQMPVPDNAAPEVGRVRARFALVAFAGELATKFGITGWKKGEAVQAVIRCFNDWLSESGGAIGADERALLSQVSAFLQAHGGSRFPPHNINPQDLQHVQNRAGFSYIDKDSIYYWVESGAFRRVLCKGFTPTSAVNILKKAGWLEAGPDRTQQKKCIPALGKKYFWFYVFNDRALGGEI